MAQQQQQLLQLRGEQERVQRLIAQQRQMQWGGTSQKQANGKGANLLCCLQILWRDYGIHNVDQNPINVTILENIPVWIVQLKSNFTLFWPF